jgi:CheY-like chemotaxis protein
MLENSALWIGIVGILSLIGIILGVIIVPSKRKKNVYIKSSHTLHEEKPFHKKVKKVSSELNETSEEKSRVTKPSPMEMTPEEAKATALPFQKPIIVRQESYKIKRYTDPIPETENIDTDCFGFFQGASILIVEDNMINQKILLSVMKKAGIHADVANNGQEALDMLAKKKHYDLIIMDISMPVMDGIDATMRIRQNPENDEIPIVTFTAFNLGPEIKRMFEAGANAYMTKPLNIKQLYTVFSLFVGSPKQDMHFDQILEVHGLDIMEGLANFDQDEYRYRTELERYAHRYAMTPKLFEGWIERDNFDRAKVELRDMYADSVKIGAFDMSTFLKELQKYFIYHNEHLVHRHLLMFRTKLQTLLDAIELYLHRNEEKNDEKTI